MPGLAFVGILATYVVLRIFNGKTDTMAVWEERDRQKGKAAKREAKKAAKKRRVKKNRAYKRSQVA